MTFSGFCPTVLSFSAGTPTVLKAEFKDFVLNERSATFGAALLSLEMRELEND